MSRDISDLVANKAPLDLNKDLTEKMNKLIAESDRELINTWHTHRRRRLWPKGISK